MAKQFSKLDISWQEIAKIDSELTQKWINTNLVSAHGLNLDISLRKAFLCDVKNFLDSEYGKSFKLVVYKPVSYLQDASFTQLGVFAKYKIDFSTEIPGLIGYLVPIEEAEIIPGYNDYSVMCSSRVGMQWIMLGPISFINASCKPNVSYVKVENIMVCAPLRVIEEGEELTISYHNHFFGENNKDFCARISICTAIPSLISLSLKREK